MKLTICRAIATTEKIDTANIGCSWSMNRTYPEQHIEGVMQAQGIEGYVILEATVDIADVDLDNSLYAMENRECELEVVINDIELTCEVVDVYNNDKYETGNTVTGEAGCNDFEDYRHGDYEGELTIENFIELYEEVC